MPSLAEARSKENAFVAGEADIIVVGAGHAGCEAALAAARLGRRVILFTMTLDSLANLPCNPNIGGTAKGQMVREIDALGGEMGRLADLHMIQYRMLNATKGPAVMSPRAQMDRTGYQRGMKQVLESEPLLTLIQQEIMDWLLPVKQVTESGYAIAVTDPFTSQVTLSSVPERFSMRVLLSATQCAARARSAAPASNGDVLTALGLPTRRFKTGTRKISSAQCRSRAMELQPADREASLFV